VIGGVFGLIGAAFGVLGGLLGLVFGPLGLMIGAVVLVGIIAAPLLPVAIFGAAGWFIYRLFFARRQVSGY
jgi:hypothetical protein